MGGVPKVSTMNNDKIILAHWDMTDCLMAEVSEIVGPEGLHGHQLMEYLFHEIASRDERFHAQGFRWNQSKGYMQFTPTYTESSDPFNTQWAANTEGVYYGEAAIAAFLGFAVKGKFLKMQASAEALRFIYREFADKVEARDWLRWHVQKLHGYTCRTRDMEKGRPRRWPIINGNSVTHWTQAGTEATGRPKKAGLVLQNNELLSEKD